MLCCAKQLQARGRFDLAKMLRLHSLVKLNMKMLALTGQMVENFAVNCRPRPSIKAYGRVSSRWADSFSTRVIKLYFVGNILK